ncbi:UvrD-helicase domain-containing protein, partial [Patescibacteria group bacterium]|nr:UvrD-helicase domain-containing protein [Patescibacteria group bacterium]
MNSFDLEYAKLNKEQKLAVDTINGPVLVLAGPGSGKTTILTLRIANILKQTDAQAENILALTFTESAAKNMKNRLINLVGKDAYYTNIYTFHAFAKMVITENPDYFVTQKEGNVATDLDKLLIIQKILQKNEFELLKPIGSVYYYTNTLLQKISTLKREGVRVKDFEKLIENNTSEIAKIETKEKNTQKDLAEAKIFKKQIEFLEVYKNYQIELKKKELIDFDDMINFVVEAFEKNEELLRNYQEKFLYTLVDEFQDTNNAQYKLLKLLTSYWREESADIFAVGDDDQSIYRFQGASVENILNFTKDFANTKLIVLTQNFRSGESIVETSRVVIKNNLQSIEKFIPNLKKQLESANKLDANIKYINFSNEILENYFIAKKIKKLIKKGEDPKEIAIIYRNNSDSSNIASILAKMDISYNLEGGENVLKNDVILQLINFFKVIEKCKHLDEDLDFFNTISFDFLQFNPLDNLKIARVSANSKKTMLDTILSENFAKSGIATYQKYIDFVSLVAVFNKTNSEFQFNKT